MHATAETSRYAKAKASSPHFTELLGDMHDIGQALNNLTQGFNRVGASPHQQEELKAIRARLNTLHESFLLGKSP
jgi:hypothetical protein